MPAFLAALMALAWGTPADAAHHRHTRTTCVPTYEPGVGPGSFCAARSRRR